jgi:hypothetical protein
LDPVTTRRKVRIIRESLSNYRVRVLHRWERDAVTFIRREILLILPCCVYQSICQKESGRSLAPIFCGLTKRVFYINKIQPHTVQQPLIRIDSNMAREVPRRRRTRVDVPCSNPPSPQAARVPQTILDTLRRARLLADAHIYIGKMPQKELFKIYNIAKSTGYKVLK